MKHEGLENTHQSPPKQDIPKVAFVGNYLPRKCGIATFTSDLTRNSISSFPDTQFSVVSVTDKPGHHDFGSEVVFEMEEQVRRTYRSAADYLNNKGTDVVCLQHEFGVYGGPAGSHILAFLDALEAPEAVASTVRQLMPVLTHLPLDPRRTRRRVGAGLGA